MKKSLSIILIFTLFISFAARAEEIISNGFIFPEYQKGKVYFQNKEIVESLLNYETLSRQMFFLRDKQALVLALPQATDSVVIAGRVFVHLQNCEFLEKLLIEKGDLYIQYNAKRISEGKAVAYGGYSQVTNAKSLGFISTMDGGNTKMLTRLQDTEKFRLDIALSFWIKQNGKFVDISSYKKLLKAFPENRNQIKSYLNEHKVNFESMNDVKRLLNYCFTIR